MISPVPYSVRLPLAIAVIALAVTIRVAGGMAADALHRLGDWIVPEPSGRRR